jgi:hypothetical protein
MALAVKQKNTKLPFLQIRFLSFVSGIYYYVWIILLTGFVSFFPLLLSIQMPRGISEMHVRDTLKKVFKYNDFKSSVQKNAILEILKGQFEVKIL